MKRRGVVAVEPMIQKLELLRDQFKADSLMFAGLHCHLYQDEMGEESRKYMSHRPYPFRFYHEFDRSFLNPDAWRALYFVSNTPFRINPRRIKDVRERSFDRQVRHSAKLNATPLYDRYRARATLGGELLKQLNLSQFDQYPDHTTAFQRWTWALFDWAFALPWDDPRYVDRVANYGMYSGSINPSKLDLTGSSFVDDKRPKEWKTNPPAQFTSTIVDAFSKSVEFATFLLTIVGVDRNANAANRPESRTADSSLISSENRTRALGIGEAGLHLGLGKGKNASRKAARKLSRLIKEGRIKCERLSNKYGVFDKCDFPEWTWPKITSR